MPATIPDDWLADERGNTWLVDAEGECHELLIDLPGGRVLSVSITPPDYPGVLVRLVRPDEDLAGYVRAHLDDGWTARKCNVPGVGLDDEDGEFGGED